MNEWICEEAPAITIDGKAVSIMLHRTQELVRCRDCKKRKTDKCLMYWNEIKDDETWDDNWFCADGERRNVEDD